MSQKMSIHEIHQYLLNRNFNLTSEKILKDPIAYSDIVWNILVFLSADIKDSRFDELEPSLAYLFDSDTQRVCAKRMKEYINVTTVLEKLSGGFQKYPFIELIKPDKQHLIERIQLLIKANITQKKVSSELETMMICQEDLENHIREQKMDLAQFSQEIQELKLQKQQERAEYQGKVLSIDNLRKQISYKKKEKIDLLNSQQELEKELTERIKKDNNLKFGNDDLAIKIQQLEREVIQNAPKLKKEKMDLKAEFERITSEMMMQQQKMNKKKEIINRFHKIGENLLERSRVDEVQKNRENLNTLNHQNEILHQQLAQFIKDRNNKKNKKNQVFKSLEMLGQKAKENNQRITAKQKKDIETKEYLKKLQKEISKYQQTVSVLIEKNKQIDSHFFTVIKKTKNHLQKILRHKKNEKRRMKSYEEKSSQMVSESFAGFE